MFQDHVNDWFAQMWVQLVSGAVAYILTAVLLFIFVGPYLHEPRKWDDKNTLVLMAASWPVVGAFFLAAGVIVGACWCVFQVFRNPFGWVNARFDSRFAALQQKAREEAEQRDAQRVAERDALKREELAKEAAARKAAQENQEGVFRSIPPEPKPCPTCGGKPFEPTPRAAEGPNESVIT